jgi:hypothetical protein
MLCVLFLSSACPAFSDLRNVILAQKQLASWLISPKSHANCSDQTQSIIKAKGGIIMADQKPKNLGQQGGIGESQHQAPGRNPQREQGAREKTGGHERKGMQYESDIERNRQDKGFKQGAQKDMRR